MNWCAFDTEDNSRELLDGSETVPRMTQIAALGSDGSGFYNKGDRKPFLKWLRQKRFVWSYAHNVQYDLGNLFRDNLRELSPVLIGTRMIRCQWKSVEFRDTMNLCNTSLALIGAALGIKKLKGRSFSDREYVERDVEIAFKFARSIMEFSGRYGISELPSTIGSLAVKIWKRQGGKNWFDDDHWRKFSYYGGRVELFAKQSLHASYTDINSMYPHAMTGQFPAQLKSTRNLDQWGIAEVTLKIPRETFVAPLPYRDEETGRKIFPVGTIRGTWTMAEIQNAKLAGAKVLKVHTAEGTDLTEKPYAEFIAHFYAERLKAKTEMERLYFKLLMNNLYGQLGTSGNITVASETANERNLVAMFGERYLVEIKVGLPKHTNYTHAAHVTSYGRIQLHNFLTSVPAKKLVYCDTDSIITDGGPFFETGSDLGQMKLVKKNAFCRVLGPKCYVFDGEYKAKGVPKSQAKEFIETGSTKFSKPARLLESLKRDLDWSIWYPQEKTMREKDYPQKIWRNNRWNPPLIGKPSK